MMDRSVFGAQVIDREACGEQIKDSMALYIWPASASSRLLLYRTYLNPCYAE